MGGVIPVTAYEAAGPQPQALHDWGTHPTDKGIAFFLQPAQIDFHLCDMA
ncbi:hypothetical protein [Klebsiella sp. JB_Kp017]